MATLDLTALKPSLRTVKVDLPAGISEARAITFPTWCRRVSFRFEADDGTYSSEGEDGATIDDDHQTVVAGAFHTFAITRSGQTGGNTAAQTYLFATLAANPTVLRLTLEPAAT